jgi:hypothetical protein
MTRWTPFTIPAGPKGPRPKDEAVPRLARCCELVEALGAVAETTPNLFPAIERAALTEPGSLRLVALEALGRRYL